MLLSYIAGFNLIKGCQPQTSPRQPEVPGWITTGVLCKAWTGVFRPSASARRDKQKWLWVHIYAGANGLVSSSGGISCCCCCLGFQNDESSKLRKHYRPSCTADKRRKQSQGMFLPVYSSCILLLPVFIKSQLLLNLAQVWEDIVTPAEKRIRLNIFQIFSRPSVSARLWVDCATPALKMNMLHVNVNWHITSVL